MTAIHRHRPPKLHLAAQYFKGIIDGEDFTANIFSITCTAGKWTITGSRVDSNGVTHKLQLSLPSTYGIGIYRLEDHPDIRFTYSTDDLLEPVLRYGFSGLVEFRAIDPSNTHATGGLSDIQTRDDGNPGSTISALFSLG